MGIYSERTAAVNREPDRIRNGSADMRARILIIEDEPEIGELISVYLEREGLETKHVRTAELGLDALEGGEFDLVVLDINLPGMDGFEFLQTLRKESALPVIIVSARNADEDLVLGLGIGADDFVTKPFSPRVLAARVRAHLRRCFSAPENETSEIRFGPYTLDTAGNVLRRGESRVGLAPKELELLKCLTSRPGEAMTPETIYEEVWGRMYGDISTVAIHVQRLRKKIEKNTSNPRYIETIKGFGYRFNPDTLGGKSFEGGESR